MNKFILVPDDLYRSLISTSETGDLNLDFTKRELGKVQREKVNDSAKNIHLNQELRRYLKFKKDLENKPVLVKLSGDDLSNIAAKTTQPLEEINQQLTELKQERRKTPKVKLSTEPSTSTQPPPGQTPPLQKIATSKPKKKSPSQKIEEQTEGGYTSDYATPTQEFPPTSSPLTPLRAEKYQDLLKLVKNSPEKYGIVGTTILSNKKTGREVANSDLYKALSKIVQIKQQEIDSGVPFEDLQRRSLVPGMNELLKRINKDKIAAEILNSKKSIPIEKINAEIEKRQRKQARKSTQPAGTATPIAPQQQHGKGFQFRPQLWNW